MSKEKPVPLNTLLERAVCGDAAAWDEAVTRLEQMPTTVEKELAYAFRWCAARGRRPAGHQTVDSRFVTSWALDEPTPAEEDVAMSRLPMALWLMLPAKSAQGPEKARCLLGLYTALATALAKLRAACAIEVAP